MATQTVATLTPAQIASITVVSNKIGKAAALIVPANTFVFWAGFDGTRNESIIRLVGALMVEQNDEWCLQRRYMQLEGLQALSENQTARLSAVILNGNPAPRESHLIHHVLGHDPQKCH